MLLEVLAQLGRGDRIEGLSCQAGKEVVTRCASTSVEFFDEGEKLSSVNARVAIQVIEKLRRAAQQRAVTIQQRFVEIEKNAGAHFMECVSNPRGLTVLGVVGGFYSTRVPSSG